ncbi:MAG: hypothetical protein FWD73_00085 [Polyangiaceae bacterium]|nr:hypothetical protein [Polyangiaceae bacterium]
MIDIDIDINIIASVAEAALAHRQTVERRMLGLPVRGRVGRRIDLELTRRGIVPGQPVRCTSGSPKGVDSYLVEDNDSCWRVCALLA